MSSVLHLTAKQPVSFLFCQMFFPFVYFPDLCSTQSHRVSAVMSRCGVVGCHFGEIQMWGCGCHFGEIQMRTCSCYFGSVQMRACSRYLGSVQMRTCSCYLDDVQVRISCDHRQISCDLIVFFLVISSVFSSYRLLFFFLSSSFLSLLPIS